MRIGCVLLAMAAAAGAQTAAFDAASVKPTPPESNDQRIEFQPGGRFRATNITLKGLLRTAYDVRGFQISGGPTWLDAHRFDVEAKALGDPRPAEVRVMIQALLAERFHLKVKRESRKQPVYWLVAAKNGPKIQRAKDESRVFEVRKGSLHTRTTLGALANVFSNWLDRLVLDRTGLEGTYEVNMEWIPEETTSPEAPEIASRPAASLFSAVREQLGLKLEARKGPVEMLVVEGAEKPDGN